VTAFSVITDYQKGIKYPLADFNITPDAAVIDPALAETMPPKLTAHTGMDALTHAVEAYGFCTALTLYRPAGTAGNSNGI
jgi:alcohol dehydrogenase class IV